MALLGCKSMLTPVPVIEVFIAKIHPVVVIQARLRNGFK